MSVVINEKDEAVGVQAMREMLAAEDIVDEIIDDGFLLNDSTLRRYYRARKGEITKAVAMLKDTIAWRKEFGLADMHAGKWDETIRLENATGKMYARGTDREGHMLLYMKPKDENTNDHDGNLKHVVYNLEKAIAAMNSLGREVEKISLLIDYEGYSLRNAPPMKTSKETLSILQNQYPERLFRAYCINSPWIMNAFWAVIRPFMDPVTQDKLSMISGNAAALAEILSVDIDPAILEKNLGGQDDRLFDSNAYISAPFPQDFLQILDRQTKEN